MEKPTLTSSKTIHLPHPEDGRFTSTLPFWEQPAHRWTGMMSAGVRATFVASSHATRLMVPRRRGLIVNISYRLAQKYLGNHGIAKAAMDKITADMAHELRAYGVAAISLYPGLVRTEAVMLAAQGGAFSLAKSESPEFTGRVVAALARDANTLERTGKVLVAAAVAAELGLTDIDSRQPRPLTNRNLLNEARQPQELWLLTGARRPHRLVQGRYLRMTYKRAPESP